MQKLLEPSDDHALCRLVYVCVPQPHRHQLTPWNAPPFLSDLKHLPACLDALYLLFSVLASKGQRDESITRAE